MTSTTTQIRESEVTILPYEPSPFTSEGQAYIELREELRRTQDECSRLQSLINSPHTADFMQAVQLEAAHQRERWATEHDAGKTGADWFWLIGYLAGKAIRPDATLEKCLHHIITTAAACLNWHAARSGVDTRMRPGIVPPASAPETEVAVQHQPCNHALPCDCQNCPSCDGRTT